MARRLSAVMAPSLQKLWERCHLTEMERMLKHDNLPMRVNPKWFRQTFLDADAPPALGPKDEVWPYVRVRVRVRVRAYPNPNANPNPNPNPDPNQVWPYVRGFNEYDGLTTVVAAT